MSFLLPMSLSSPSSSSESGGVIKRSKAMHFSSSLSPSSCLSSQRSLNLERLPVLFIREIFDFLPIDENASSLRTCRQIRAVLLLKAASHFVLDRYRMNCSVDVVKRYISEKNFGFIRTIDLGCTQLDEMREVFTHQMPSLTKLTLPPLTHNMAPLLTAHCSELIFLNFSDAKNQTLSEMRLPNLRELDFPGSDNISRSEMVSLAINSPQLESLSLKNCDEEGLDRAITTHEEDNSSDLSLFAFPNLKSLNLKKCGIITDLGLLALAKNSPELEELHLDGCRFRQEEEGNEFKFVFPHLKFLSMHSISSSRSQGQFDLSRFHCRELEEFSFKRPGHLSPLIDFLKKIPSFYSLRVELCDNVRGFSGLSQLKNLNELKFNFSNEGEHFQKALQIVARSCPRLEILDISERENHWSWGDKRPRLFVTPQLVRKLNFPELTTLCFPLSSFQEKALDEMSRKFPKLERLEISLGKVSVYKRDEGEEADTVAEGEGGAEREEEIPALRIEPLRRLAMPNLRGLLLHCEESDGIEPEVVSRILNKKCPRLQKLRVNVIKE